MTSGSRLTTTQVILRHLSLASAVQNQTKPPVFECLKSDYLVIGDSSPISITLSRGFGIFCTFHTFYDIVVYFLENLYHESYNRSKLTNLQLLKYFFSDLFCAG